jgi:4-diphosphocytidyl-2-C-methyl-D-erythritol kinase
LLKLPSFAKINWNLRILGRRPDGYHEVATVLQSISLCDELTFTLRDDHEISLTCDDPAIPVDETNLIVRAARALSDQRGVHIQLLKKIPAKGGLGGGFKPNRKRIGRGRAVLFDRWDRTRDRNGDGVE